MGIFDKFKSGFKKSASAFTSGLRDIVVKKEIDDKTLDRIEEYLIQSDVGTAAAAEIKEIISDSKIDPNKDIAEEINVILKEYIVSLMKPLENNDFFRKKEKINATLVSGVNGVGKTTTIGKISKILKANGNKVMLAASDTFRAAAIEQLEDWANKVEVEITKSSQGADPASVAYKAIEEAINNNFNQVLIDTAGRLQNKKNLMEEYKKIANVTKKIDPEAPHDVVLVLDAYVWSKRN
jgi:fused signal recognition particle receptor